MKQTRLISLILAIVVAVSGMMLSVTFAEDGAVPECGKGTSRRTGII